MASTPDNRFAADEARRNSDHISFLKHRSWRWLKVALVVSLVCIASYMLIDVQPRHNGGSWYGYTLGTIGAGLIVWLALLGIRKRRMTEGQWSLKAWTSAHVYLGLALIVIGTLHTGFQLGWNVHTLAWALMIVVIVSGMYGIAVYALLPQKVSENRREMTKAEMLEALAAIDRQLENASQPLGREASDLVIAALEQDPFDFGIMTRLSGNYRKCRTIAALDTFGPGGSHDEATDKVVKLLRKRRAQLDQIRRQMKLRALLDVWLYVHVPVTIALLAALTAHIISVFYYW
ncbi:hypothetical protein OZN62_07725 [Aurantiacibacter sp. MUD11]|uniref:hypothetical protein n=1 Tax=Aurantiacibacter sp. MUD11 TaxID=3003265 RepID=UPI0022AAD8F7|nr:hypothetical protein [Aurantiacibacter sp. MUD11]WAT16835.1 hypothetical protein OZN62_07725 [Aurantiacibacter sp. MUD11]